jgi:hypothetical protein
MQSRLNIHLAALLLLASATFSTLAEEAVRDPETWQVESGGIQVRLTQITPNQARAFYQARGFSSEQAEHYANGCVFMTVVRNIGATPIQHNLSNWRYVTADGQPRQIRSKAAWTRYWQRLGVPEPAQIAFTWAQFPAAQSFAAGDWNQGMTHYALPRGARFDLRFTWSESGKPRHGKLENLRCADENQD